VAGAPPTPDREVVLSCIGLSIQICPGRVAAMDGGSDSPLEPNGICHDQGLRTTSSPSDAGVKPRGRDSSRDGPTIVPWEMSGPDGE